MTPLAEASHGVPHLSLLPDSNCLHVMPLYSNDLIFIEIHESEVPWLKVFTQRTLKEFSQCSVEEKVEIWRVLDIIERLMLKYYQADKINIASFGNMFPHVHWHITARFKNDSYFPEPMWGTRQRESTLTLPPFDPFAQKLLAQLSA